MPKGDGHRKLNAADMKEIKRFLKKGIFSDTLIAEWFPVTRERIGQIKRSLKYAAKTRVRRKDSKQKYS